MLSEIIEESPKDKRLPCLETLKKLFENILANRTEDKYKIIKRSNKAIQTKVFGVVNIETFLIMVGYEPVDEDILKFMAPYESLEDGRNQVVLEIRKLGPKPAPVDTRPLTEEEIKKQKLMEEQQRKYREEMQAKKKYIEQL